MRIHRTHLARGIGDLFPFSNEYCASSMSYLNPLRPFGCTEFDLGATQSTQIPEPAPPPAPPNTSANLIPASSTDPGAIYAGTDASGNPVYVKQQTTDQATAQNNAALNDYIQQQSAAIQSGAYGGTNSTTTAGLQFGLGAVVVGGIVLYLLLRK